jgi:hypothetical protein
MISSASMLIELEPANPSRWQVFMKTFLGFIVGIFIAFLVFVILLLVGGVVQEALAERIMGGD